MAVVLKSERLEEKLLEDAGSRCGEAGSIDAGGSVSLWRASRNCACMSGRAAE